MIEIFWAIASMYPSCVSTSFNKQVADGAVLPAMCYSVSRRDGHAKKLSRDSQCYLLGGEGGGWGMRPEHKESRDLPLWSRFVDGWRSVIQ